MKRRILGKRIALALAMMALTGNALAVTQDEALATAQGLAGASAQLVESERDDGIFEFELRDGDVRYDVDIRESDGAVIEFETEYANISGAASAALTEAEAKAKAIALYPDAAVALALPEREDGGMVYEIFLVTGGRPAALTINAETGETLRIETYPAAAGILSADRLAAITGAPITELELAYDDGKYVFEADAASREFKIDAVTGAVLESEIDD